MSEWLGKSRIQEEDIRRSLPSLAEFFPMLTRYFVDDQKMRLNMVLSYEQGDKFKAAVIKKYGHFSPATIRKVTAEAVDNWLGANS